MKTIPHRPLARRLRRCSCSLASVAAVFLISMFELSAVTPLPIPQEAALKASNTGPNDGSSHTAAVSGNLVLVGGNLESTDATGVNGDQRDDRVSTGNVYVADRDNNRTTKDTPVLAAPPPVPAVPVAPPPTRPSPIPAPPAQPRSPQEGAIGSDKFSVGRIKFRDADVLHVLQYYQELTGRTVIRSPSLPRNFVSLWNETPITRGQAIRLFEDALRDALVEIVPKGDRFAFALPPAQTNALDSIHEPPDLPPPPGSEMLPPGMLKFAEADVSQVIQIWQELTGRTCISPASLFVPRLSLRNQTELTKAQAVWLLEAALRVAGVEVVPASEKFAFAVQPEWTNALPRFDRQAALAKVVSLSSPHPPMPPLPYSLAVDAQGLVKSYAAYTGRQPLPLPAVFPAFKFYARLQTPLDRAEFIFLLGALAQVNGGAFELVGTNQFRLVVAGNRTTQRTPVAPGGPPIPQ
jgi:hypothetical protein